MSHSHPKIAHPSNTSSSSELNWTRRQYLERVAAAGIAVPISMALGNPASALPTEVLATEVLPTAAENESATDESIQTALERIRSEAGLPSLIAGFVDKQGGYEVQCCGLRNVQSNTPLLRDDSMHLGSCTKSMTATLVAMFIEEGKLDWNSTLGELCQNVRSNDETASGEASSGEASSDEASPGKTTRSPDALSLDKTPWGQITVEQIMEHTAALPANAPWSFWLGRKDLVKAREEIAGWLISQTFDPKALGTLVYSNVGYMLLGHFLERLENKPWEEIIAERIFKPLGMKSAGFGSPAELADGRDVWGHFPKENREQLLKDAAEKTSLNPQDLWSPTDIDNPPVLGPAGTVQASMEDWAKYLRTHLLNPGEPNFPFGIGQANWERLHAPKISNNYAGGWVVEERDWAEGKVYFHNGSNSVWYCITFLAPRTGVGIFAATNCGLESANDVDKALQLVINRWLPLRLRS